MARDSLLRCRVSEETKSLLQSVASQKGLTGSGLLRQVLEAVLGMASMTEVKAGQPYREPRDSRLYVRLRPDDRALLAERAARRGLASATYASVLLRSHLRHMAPLPRDELAALERSVAELGAIGRTLNQSPGWRTRVGRVLDRAGKTFGRC